MAPTPRPVMASASKAEKEADVVMGVCMTNYQLCGIGCADKVTDKQQQYRV